MSWYRGGAHFMLGGGRGRVAAGEGAPHREALTVGTVGSCRDRDHWALDRRRVWLRDSWEAEDVVGRDSRHAVVPTRSAALRNVSVRAGPGRRMVRYLIGRRSAWRYRRSARFSEGFARATSRTPSAPRSRSASVTWPAT